MSAVPVTYHIVGGGIAGLSCAWFLKQKNKNIRTIIYEAAPKLGGRAYSYHDASLDARMDNAVHAIAGANKFLARFIQKHEWNDKINFVSPDTSILDTSLYQNRGHLFKSFCNTRDSDIDKAVKKRILKMLFPFTKSKRRVWFSKQNLSQRIINVLAGYADEIHLNSKLNKVSGQFGLAAQLKFDKKTVDIGAHDKVIIALDNTSCSKVLNVPVLEHNQIVNIIYRVSQTIFLPKGSSFIGIKDGIGDWVFSNGNLLSVVISDYQSGKESLQDLAIKAWTELDKIRGVNSAFMPPHKIFCCKNATIRQNAENNIRRPDTAKTEYPNVFIAGDWTMKDYPCCMETAVQSALRAVKTALKSV